MDEIGLSAAEDWQRKTCDLRTKLLPRRSQRVCGIKKISWLSQMLEFLMFRGDYIYMMLNCDIYLSIQTKFTATKLEYKLVYTISCLF